MHLSVFYRHTEMETPGCKSSSDIYPGIMSNLWIHFYLVVIFIDWNKMKKEPQNWREGGDWPSQGSKKAIFHYKEEIYMPLMEKHNNFRSNKLFSSSSK